MDLNKIYARVLIGVMCTHAQRAIGHTGTEKVAGNVPESKKCPTCRMLARVSGRDERMRIRTILQLDFVFHFARGFLLNVCVVYRAF